MDIGFTADTYGSQVAADLAVDDWIERVHNRRGRRSATGENSHDRGRRSIHSRRHEPPDLVCTNGVKPTHACRLCQGGGIGLSATLAPCRRPPESPPLSRPGRPHCSYRPVAARLLATTLIPWAPMTSR